MKIAPLAEVKDKLSAYINESQKTPIVITKNGRPVALLTGLEEDKDLDTILLAHNPRFLQIVDEARERVRKTGGIPHDKFWKELARRRKAMRK